VRDATWADTLFAMFLIAWGLFVVFGGLAALGWWLGGVFSTEPRAPRDADVRQASGRVGVQPEFDAPSPQWRQRREGEYIVYDDQDSTAQVLEDDREWHHDRRYREGYGVCPECGASLRSSG
jgi:hypothetical protein